MSAPSADAGDATTGAELKVGDIRVTEHNIHAGTKYMDQLMSRYF